MAKKILIACEESQRVCISFRNRGYDSFSCDLLPCSGGHPEWHIQGDVRSYLNENWDLIIAFPPCTHLASSGAPSWNIKQSDGRQQEAIEFFMCFFKTNCNFIAVENPAGIISTVFRKPNQYIHPYQFGEPYLKRTGLWLKNLPELVPTNIVEPEYHWTSNSTRGGLLKTGTRRKSKLPIRKAWDNSIERSKTFFGIAEAMAEQWIPILNAFEKSNAGGKNFKNGQISTNVISENESSTCN